MTEIVAEYESPEAAQVLERLRVLVIDGRDITRRALGLILGAAGADVTGAESLAEAQAHLAVRRFDAIVTDAELPGLRRREGRPVLGGLTGPNAEVPVVRVNGRLAVDPPALSHAAGMTMEIGSAIDPGRICRSLAGLSHPPPGARAA